MTPGPLARELPPSRVVVKRPLGFLWVFATLVTALCGLAGVDGDYIGAIVLFSAVILTTISSRELASDRRLRLAFLVVMGAHAAVCIVDGLVAITFGAEADAYGFHEWAMRFAWTHAIDPDLVPAPFNTYTHFLGYVYRYLGTSLFLGNAVSVLGVALSCLLFAKVLRLTGVTRRAGVLLLFGLLPSGVMFMSVTLREPFQQLFVLLALYAMLRMRGDARWFLVVLVAAVGMALSHQGLGLYAGFFIASILTWTAGGALRRGSWFRFVGTLVVAAGVLVVSTQIPAGKGALEAFQQGQSFEYADSYRRLGESIESRTTYGLQLDASSPVGLVRTLPIVFLEYMFAPLPWQVGSTLDLEALFESLLRLMLIVAGVVRWRRARGAERSQLSLLLGLYFGMEFLWSLGTINWGTAIRHHLPGYAILVVIGGPPLVHGVSDWLRRAVVVQRSA